MPTTDCFVRPKSDVVPDTKTPYLTHYGNLFVSLNGFVISSGEQQDYLGVGYKNSPATTDGYNANSARHLPRRDAHRASRRLEKLCGAPVSPIRVPRRLCSRAATRATISPLDRIHR